MGFTEEKRSCQKMIGNKNSIVNKQLDNRIKIALSASKKIVCKNGKTSFEMHEILLKENWSHLRNEYKISELAVMFGIGEMKLKDFFREHNISNVKTPKECLLCIARDKKLIK